MNAVHILLIQIAVILVLSRVMGVLMRFIHQPQVVGEMLAGIMLGPSLLGLIHHGSWMHWLFPASSMGSLDVLSQLGVMLFMFLVGLELDPKLLRGQGKAALMTGTMGILIPFVLGGALGLLLIYTQTQITGHVPSKLVLCMFMGAAMSITAFPVLARILTERNLHKTRSGTLALTCAAMDDVMGWCILAFVLAVAQLEGFGNQGGQGGQTGPHGSALRSALITVGFSAGYVVLMVFVVRRLLGRLQAHFESRGYLSQSVLALLFLLLIASSLSTDAIGIHQIFGAFLFGAVMPKNGPFIKHLGDKIEDFTVLFLLPLFFAYTGLRTELGLLGSADLWAICLLIVVVAVAGKFGGVTLAARFYGMNWRRSALLGVLMNTRGLMELIILNIGLTFGVLSKSLFAMMVVMALATTFMTMPLMRLLYSPKRQRKELEEAAREEAARVSGVHVVVPVSLESTAPPLITIGSMLVSNDQGRIYAIHLERPDEVDRRAKNVLSESDQVLTVAQTAAKARNTSIQVVSFVSRNIGRDIADAAERYIASWVVMGWHKPVFFRNVLGGVVGQVLRQAPANIAIFCDKGLAQIKTILVPYLGEAEDRGALLAAERMGRVPGVSVTILHVVKPNRTDAEPRQNVQGMIDREFPGDDKRGDVRVRVVESDSPIEMVVQESREYDLMVLGLSDEWNIEGGGAAAAGKHESVAQASHCSLLIVHQNPKAPVVEAAKTTEQEQDSGLSIPLSARPTVG